MSNKENDKFLEDLLENNPELQAEIVLEDMERYANIITEDNIKNLDDLSAEISLE